VGRWGEALVHNYLLATLPPHRRVEWLNETDETKAPYDLKISERSGLSGPRGTLVRPPPPPFNPYMYI